jgi:hypothetical protein
MDDDYRQDDFFSALYVALDTLEELDPATAERPWFQLLQTTADKTTAARLEQVESIKH